MAVKILGWNINGLRSLKANMKEFLDDLNADIICFQETKITRDMLTEELAIVDGYHSFFNFSQKRSGYSGVATYCKKTATPISASTTLSKLDLDVPGQKKESSSLAWTSDYIKSFDLEGRAVVTRHLLKSNSGEEIKLCIFNVYCPRADPERPERATFKMDFYALLREQTAALRDAGQHIIIIGDINTSHRRIDHCDPSDTEEFENREDRRFLDSFFYSQEELELTELNTTDESHSIKLHTSSFNNKMIEESSECHDDSLSFSDMSYKNFKVVDSFRYFHPSQEGAFTCWNTKVNARATNYGTRIDYVLCDKQFLDYVNDSCIHPDTVGSDHCPVSVFLKENVSFVQSSVIPTSCSKYFPEFQGNQQRLSSYFGPASQQPRIDETRDKFLNTSCKRKPLLEDKSAKRSHSENKKQMKLSSFFNKVARTTPEESSKSNTTPNSFSSPERKPEFKSRLSPSLGEKDSPRGENDACRFSSRDSKSGWGFLMKGPKPPPLCPGHKEPSVLRTVKKRGPNFNRQFYACARGAGKEGDPNAQCNFFKWS